MTWLAGADVWVDIDGHTHPGSVVRDEHGWIVADILTDPTHDYGAAGPRVMPVQTVAVRAKYVTGRDN